MANKSLTYNERIEKLRQIKQKETAEKQEIIGSMDHDDWAIVLPPPDRRKIKESMSSSGMPITDVILDNYEPESNHPEGGFFGPEICGSNYRKLLEKHPPYVNRYSSLAGRYMVNFMTYRDPHWNPDLDYSHLKEKQEKYQLVTGIGASQHFCQDMEIGLELGWQGILNKIEKYRKQNPESNEFYNGLEDIVSGLQNWIKRTSKLAQKKAEKEDNLQLKENLSSMAEINQKLITEPPSTFREACQWIVWFLLIARMYNGSGSLGTLDQFLEPYYKKDREKGILTREEAIYHIACLLLADTAYLQLGGLDKEGNDTTGEVSYLVLEAAHRLKIPANIGVSVGEKIDSGLLKRGVEIQFEDKTGIPKFLGTDNIVKGFARNKNMNKELGRQRAYAGCHWFGIPGREYTIMDTVKINFGVVFDVAFKEMMKDNRLEPGIDELWKRFKIHLKEAIKTIARGLDFHLENMHQVFPELVLDLLCHGPIEKGEDASHGGVEFYNMCVDGAGLATTADSFAALEKRIEKEERFTWEEIYKIIQNNWEGPKGEQARLLMKNIPRYGRGNTQGDKYAVKITEIFTEMVKEDTTPEGYNMIPGIFSWANTIPMGKNLEATPNGRYAGDPISHGANPDPGFREDGAATAMARAIASVQCGYGNTVPMQIEIDPEITEEEQGVEYIMSLIKTHFNLGGTMINMNIMDEEKVLEAHEDPEKHPDLVVRVTGFSAYFSSLSQEFRQLVVDRILSKQS
ncbi:MAG: pyruvate formate lyase family protein [bacterium]